MKWLILLCALVLVSGIVLSFGVTDTSHELDMIEVNRIVRSIEEEWPAVLSGRLPDSDFGVTFVETGDSLHTYIQNRDTLVPIFIDGQAKGTVVFPNEVATEIASARLRFSMIFYSQVVLLTVIAGLFVFYQYKTILHPFKKLESFASRVASGDLGSPLEMDRENHFGAFSESFDLMREQLAISRENERLANISKKELVASLSHDIKTPAASIKVIAELYQAKHGKHGEIDEINSIIGKVDQIDLLISNMFSASLEELEQLKVSVTEISTAQLEEDIRAADFKQKIRPFHLPDCVLAVDRLRFRQIMDNIIGNSYKYADTEIEVSGGFEGEYFILTVRDFGSGVSEDELSLLCEKFYRAENSNGKNGAGLGLYLSSYFLSEMGGSLTVMNQNGLCVVMCFPI